MNNREQLIDLMIEHQLQRREVAELLSVERDTVDGWLASGESSRHRDVPTMAIELLQFKLEARRPPSPD